MDFTKVTGTNLLAPVGYEDLTEDAKKDICNGMGPKGWGWLVPNHFFGMDMTEAGNIHDYSYSVGGTNLDKIKSDCAFLYNMVCMIYQEPDKRYRRSFMALRYFTAVFWGGNKSFNWEVK